MRFPGSTRVGDQVLVLNGLGLREVTFLKLDVYVAALYLPARSDDAEEILAGRGTKRLALRFLRSGDRGKMEGAMGDHFAAEGLRQEFATFVRLLPEELPSGTRLTLTHHPGRGLEVAANGRRRGMVGGDAFARSLFGAFLGDASEDEELRAGLLGGPCE